MCLLCRDRATHEPTRPIESTVGVREPFPFMRILSEIGLNLTARARGMSGVRTLFARRESKRGASGGASSDG